MRTLPGLNPDMLKSPIVIIDDDADDCYLLTTALKEVGVKNECLCFNSAAQALMYLKTTPLKTFIIVCDINMPHMNGYQFKKLLNEDLTLDSKKIPFIFFSTSNDETMVANAYKLNINGYFQKPSDYLKLIELSHYILNYWTNNEYPQFN